MKSSMKPTRAKVMGWDGYPAGYFTDPCRAWFGPGWEPLGSWGRDDIAIRDAAVRGRNTQLAAGYTGTIQGLTAKVLRINPTGWNK
jgi:hypothetical protein